MRRDFEILEEDQDFLESLDLPWETVKDGNSLWVIVHRHPLPDGYNQDVVSLAVNVPIGYPRTQLDMAYFFPALSRMDGQPIGALAQLTINGKIWQRWSRHRTGKNPWREGIDCLATHFALIDHWLHREFKLRPYAVPA